MTIVAKFKCRNVSPSEEGEYVTLEAVTADTPENKTWSEFTPSGRVDLLISNPKARGQFVEDQEYLLTFAPASA